MSEAPVQGLLDFSKAFVLETNACGKRVGAVLMQEGRPLAFISQALASRHEGLSIYEKELLAVLIAVDKWRHYLEGATFVIKTDHKSLKFLLQQKLYTQLQKKGMTKLMGLDYIIQYKKGKENIAINALYRCQEKGELSAISTLVPDWYWDVASSYESDEGLKQLLE